MSAVLKVREAGTRYLDGLQPTVVQQFELLATARHGVSKLRELILALAISGKLVPQVISNESADLLLERIRGEKERLASNGARRRNMTSVPVEEQEGPYELPAGWRWTSLASIGLINPRTEAPDDATASFVQMSSIPVGYMESHAVEPRLWRDIKSGFVQFAEGDVGVAKITPCFENGKSTVFANLSNGIGAGTTELHVVRPLGGVVSKYVLVFLKSPAFLVEGEALMTGSAGQKRLPRSYFESRPFPLPPLAEQARIVARVDELMRLCDALESKGRLEAEQHARLLATLLGTLTESRSPEELAASWQRVAAHFDLLLDRREAVDALEQAVLLLAMRGLLAAQNPTDEPAAVCLQRIQNNRKSEKRPAVAGQAKPRTNAEDGGASYELPAGWEWARIGEISQSRLGKMLDKAKNRGQAYPYLRNTNVQWGRFDIDDIKLIRLEDQELREYRVQPEDLLVCEGGEPGRCAVWVDQSREMYFQKALHRVRPEGGISSRFLALCLEADARSGWLSQFFTGATIKHFVGKELDRYVVPLPPVAEQSRIVARVDQLRRLCTDLREKLTAVRAVQSRIAQALAQEAVQPRT